MVWIVLAVILLIILTLLFLQQDKFDEEILHDEP